MFDTELALDTLSQIKDTLSMIMARTSHIHKVDDFYMNASKILGKTVDEVELLFSENFRTLLK